MSLDGFVHGIGSEIDFAGPCDSAILDVSLSEAEWIGQGGKDTGIWRFHKGAHIDDPCNAVMETDGEAIGRQGDYIPDVVRRCGNDGRVQGRGAIFFGDWLRKHRSQFSINSF